NDSFVDKVDMFWFQKSFDEHYTNQNCKDEQNANTSFLRDCIDLYSIVLFGLIASYTIYSLHLLVSYL
nr:hypothetical protein [Bacteroidales bacterium]